MNQFKVVISRGHLPSCSSKSPLFTRNNADFSCDPKIFLSGRSSCWRAYVRCSFLDMFFVLVWMKMALK